MTLKSLSETSMTLAALLMTIDDITERHGRNVGYVNEYFRQKQDEAGKVAFTKEEFDVLIEKVRLYFENLPKLRAIVTAVNNGPDAIGEKMAALAIIDSEASFHHTLLSKSKVDKTVTRIEQGDYNTETKTYDRVKVTDLFTHFGERKDIEAAVARTTKRKKALQLEIHAFNHSTTVKVPSALIEFN